MRLLAGLILITASATSHAGDAIPAAAQTPPAADDRQPAIVVNRATCDWCQWIAETPNFRVYWCPAGGNVRRFAAKCERLAALSRSSWLDQQTQSSWTPKCDIVVHRGVAEYVTCLGPGSQATSGCASIRPDGDRVVMRRIDLRVDAPTGCRRACRTN